MKKRRHKAKEFPECLQIIDNITNEQDIVDMCAFAYKEFAQSIGKASMSGKAFKTFKNKLRLRFLELSERLCDIIYDISPKTKLLQCEFIKLCVDFFRALQADYERRGLTGFKTASINGQYAVEVFEEFCVDEFGSIKDYIKEMFPIKKKFIDMSKVFRPKAIPKRRIHFRQNTVIEKSTGVEGLFELVII